MSVLRARCWWYVGLLAGLALVAAGCGGSKRPSVAHIGRVPYASCMRAHGVSDFPDSAVSVIAGRVKTNVSVAVKHEAAFPSASRVCQRHLPAGNASTKHVNVSGEIRFARCMRSHDISDFPDPLPGGGFNIPGNTDSPRFKAAEAACQRSLGS